MLVIRDAQLAAFERERKSDYVERMVRYVAEGFPAKYEKLRDEGSRRMVESAIEAGAKHKIQTEPAVTILLELMLQFGESFHYSPDKAWAREILAHPKLPESLKVRLIRERMMARSQGRNIVVMRVSEQPAGGPSALEGAAR